MDPINTQSKTTETQSAPDAQTQGAVDSSVLPSNIDATVSPEAETPASDESKIIYNASYTTPNMISTETKNPNDIPPQGAKPPEISPTMSPQINRLSDDQITEMLKDDAQPHKAPMIMINLFKKDGDEPTQTEVAPQEPTSTPPTPPNHSKKLLITSAIATLAIVVAASAFVSIAISRKSSVAVVISPTPIINPTPSASPSPTPAPTPEVTPAQTSTPATVTAPTTTPTTDHPQMVTVQAKSGLWLRSSPTSINQDNVIGWMPNNAQVSVDQIGVFWWHGTYAGKTGYFASKYTQ